MSKPRQSILEALISRRPREALRRPDFKGERRRISLRLSKRMVLDLEIIKLASGEDKNAFAERHLDRAIEAELKQLRMKHGDEAWQFILARAAARLG